MYSYNYSFSEFAFLMFAYLCGSIPFGLIITKLVGKTDVRKHGSGSIGATNVARVLGKTWAALTVLLDGLKGFIPVLLANSFFKRELGDLFIALTGIMAILGHIFPLWLKFKGGKGIATTIFVLLAVNWGLGLFLCLIWFNVFLLTRISAVASLTAMFLTTLLALFYSSFEIAGMCLFLCIIIFIKHKENIKRILRKEELKF
jgi:acyl phosphate:glycerol-3-phosphate acyltransferase